jgi:hypothetical protein
MAIRINLLAEDLAAQEAARKDPAKRAIAYACYAVGLVVVWMGWLQLRLMNANNDLANYQSRWAAVQKPDSQVTSNRLLTARLESNLRSLYQLSTNRYLWGNALNALQQVLTDDTIQVTRLAVRQSYTSNAPGALKTNLATKTPLPSGPTATENITLAIDAKDTGAPADQGYLRFKEALANFPYFRGYLASNGLSLTGFSAPQPNPDDPARSYVTFTLECRFQETTR